MANNRLSGHTGSVKEAHLSQNLNNEKEQTRAFKHRECKSPEVEMSVECLIMEKRQPLCGHMISTGREVDRSQITKGLY